MFSYLFRQFGPYWRAARIAITVAAVWAVAISKSSVAEEVAKAQGWRKVTETRSRQLNGLAYRKGPDGKAVGRLLPLTISIAPSNDDQMHVGFFESDVSGSGGMWEASGWMATIAAFEMTGFDPRSARISFDVSGYADGPSAGGLLTIGVLATLLDHPIRQDAAMTGTINPDGTIGPVGGIAHKIEGAADEGKKLVLIPAGTRMQQDLNLEAEVDLIQIGRDLGIEVREVRDVYQAYELLTGKSLNPPNDANHPQMSPAGYAIVKNRTDAWLNHFEQVKAKYDQLSEDSHTEHMEEATVELSEMAENARRLLREGEVGGAYMNAFSAGSEMDAALQLGRAVLIYDESGLEGMRAAAAAIDAHKHIKASMISLKRFRPKTVGDVSALLGAYASLAIAIGEAAAADNLFSRETDDEEKAYDNVYWAYYYRCLAISQVHLANESLTICRDSGDAPLPADMPLEAAAHFFFQAATANVNVFESVIVDEAAKELNATPAVIRQVIFDKDDDYAIVRANTMITLPLLAEQLGADSEAYQYAKLGTAIEAYVLSSSLVAEYYSLGIEHDDFVPVKLKQDALMANMLDFAEAQSRRSVNLLTRHGIEARWPIAAYGIEGARGTIANCPGSCTPCRTIGRRT